MTPCTLHRLRIAPALALAVLVILGSGSCFARDAKATQPSALGADDPAGEVHIYKTSSGQPRKLELFRPPHHNPATNRVPGLILFHGGAWTGGSLGQFRAACAYFASRGLVCATAEYRMLSKAEAASLPQGHTRKRVCVTDAKSAIRWFKQQSDRFGMDPNRIITGGGSAGGHISALATLNPGLNDPADPANVDTRVVAYLWFNPAFATDDSQDPEIDILRHIRSDLPPAIAFFGDQDPWKKGWDEAHRRWQTAGVKTIELRIAPGEGHSFFNRDPWRTATLIAADRFLAHQGLLQGEPTLQAKTPDAPLRPSP